MMNSTDAAIHFLGQVEQEVLDVKPEATDHEVIGVAYQILSKTIETLKNEELARQTAEQLQKSSPIEGEAGAPREPEQVQGAGSPGGIEESPQGIRKKRRRSKRGGSKKPTSS